MAANKPDKKVSWGAAIAATLFVFALATDQVMMPIATSAVVAELNTDTGMVQAAIALVSLVAAPLYIAGGKLGKQAFVEGFQIALGVLVAVILLSMLLSSFIPKVDTDNVTAGEIQELVADVSSKRL